MPIAAHIRSLMQDPNASLIRRMFEEGKELKKKYGSHRVFDFSLGNPCFSPAKEVLSLIKKTARENPVGVHGYMPNAGYPFTRNAIAKKISREQHRRVEGSHVVMTVGAASALNCVLKAILSPSDEVIVPSPFFPEYVHYAANHGGALVPVKTGPDFSLDIEAIGRALGTKTAAIIINSPHNPTGRIYPESAIKALAQVLREHGEREGRLPCLIADEPYRAIYRTQSPEPAPIFPHYPNAVVVSSFAKDLSLAGERIGYIGANPDMEDAAELIGACTLALRILGFVNAPAFFQRVIARTALPPRSEAIHLKYERLGLALQAILDDLSIAYAKPEGAFYLFCKVPSHKDGKAHDDIEFCEHLKKHRILSVPGTAFNHPGWFRLSYCVDHNTIQKSREAFADALHAWKTA